MNRFIIYGFVTLLFVAGLFAWIDKSQINALRELVGLDPLYRSEASDMSAAERAEATERLAATPVPGVLDEPPTLGKIADAAIACIGSGEKRKPQGRAAAALRRYLLVLAASGLEREHPMVEPKLRQLYPLTGQGPMAALEAAQKDELTAQQRDLLREFYRTYGNPDHPLYQGLQLYGGTFEALDFEAAAAELATNWREISDCTVAKALPPLAEWERLAVE